MTSYLVYSTVDGCAITVCDINNQCRISTTLAAPKMITGAPLMVVYKKSYATSRGRMAFKTKYPNCRHNFGRTRPV